MNNEPNRKARRDSAQKCIREYIEYHQKHNTFIESKAQIYSELKDKPEFYQTTEPTFYRYLSNMKIEQVATGKYDFVETVNPSFDKLVTFQKCNKFVCLKIEEPSYGQIMADKLNEYYSEPEYRNLFHCIAINDLLICFYYQKIKKKKNKDEDEELFLTEKEICEDVKECLAKYSLRIETEEEQ